VEVYLPEYGWTRFDPTPAGPRTETERQAVADARESDLPDVDTAGSANATLAGTTAPTGNETAEETTTEAAENDTSTTTAAAADANGTNATTTAAPPQVTVGGPAAASGTGADAGGGTRAPSLPQLAAWTLLAVGLLAAARRSGLAGRLYRAAWLRYLPRDDPAAVVEGAYERAEYALGRRVRPRRDTETVREFLDAVDAGPAARRLARLRETARYGDPPTEADAQEARRLIAAVRGDNGDNV
jgi:hypothetical protein